MKKRARPKNRARVSTPSLDWIELTLEFNLYKYSTLNLLPIKGMSVGWCQKVVTQKCQSKSQLFNQNARIESNQKFIHLPTRKVLN